MRENEKLNEYQLKDVKQFKVHGRNSGNYDPVTLFWTGSAVEFNAKGSELWVEIEADYDAYEPWISIMINGVQASRRMVAAGKHWICIFRGMNTEVVKNVKIIRDMQAMNEDDSCLLNLCAVRFDGEFLPVEDKPYKIEFIGDSITSGEGCNGAKSEEDWISMWFSSVNNYTAMTAQAMNAEYRVLSQSGWGVLSSWNNNPRSSLPNYYEKVCGVLNGDKNRKLGAWEDNDFTSWQPDFIVVNLGTNDAGAFYSPEWKDPITGRIYKQRLNEDGSFHSEDLKAFEAAAESFLVKLRSYNKKSSIVWVYGMLGTPMMPAIKHAVAEYIRKTGDQRVSVLELPNMTEETAGARQHPGARAHEQAAEVLAEYLRTLL